MAFSARISWASLSPSSPALPSHPKSSSWRTMASCDYLVHKHINFKGTSAFSAHGVPASTMVLHKRPLLFYANSEWKSSQTEFDSNDIEEEKLQPVEEEKSMEDISSSVVERAEGKPGFISFHGFSYQNQKEGQEVLVPSLDKEPSNLLWFIGPTVLVASFVLPSLYMRRVVSIIFEDSLLTDFLILFFTEALFYGGVAIFVLLIDHVWQPLCSTVPKIDYPKSQFGLRISSVAVLVLSLIIPLVTMGMVWPWTGPAASATLAPYLVGLLVQFAFEQYARHRKSTAWPVIPVIFQVYRLHQLNRAAQLVTALSYSVRGAETTSQTLAINNSLGTLLNVLQILGIICVWSLASFFMRSLPSSPVTPDP